MRDPKNTLLWSFELIEGQPSYFFGTMHVRDEQAFYLEEQLEFYIRSCTYFAAELDMDSPMLKSGAFQQLNAPVKLSDLLTTGQYKTLDKCCRKYLGISASLVDGMYPLILVQLFTAAIFQSNKPVPLDQSLWSMAANAGKECSGLESFEEQLDDFHSISMRQQKKSLIQIIRNFGKYRKHLLKLLDYYQKGDIRALYLSTKKSLGKSRSHLLYKRNERLAQRMVSIEKNDTVFAAVGAAHLWGKYGIIRHLKSSGYKVKPVGVKIKPHGDQEEQ